jgi:hypothetical protein
VQIDGERVEEALRHGIPKDRLEIRKLTGNEVTPAAILGYYQRLKAGASDALFFFFAGHGALEVDGRGQYLWLQEGKAGNLYRNDLRLAMLRKRAGLTILVTDCCSEKVKARLKGQWATRDVRPLHSDALPIFRCLFFQHRGLVDVTAATDNCSWGDEKEGGLFTRNFGKLLANSSLRDVDANHDGFVSWKEFFTKVRAQTEKTFSVWAPKERATGGVIDQSTQTPHAFVLSEGATPAVTLLNETNRPLRYQFRWTGERDWQSATIPPGDAGAHTPARGSRAAARLEVKLDGQEVLTCEPGRVYHETGKKRTRSLKDDDPLQEAPDSRRSSRP